MTNQRKTDGVWLKILTWVIPVLMMVITSLVGVTSYIYIDDKQETRGDLVNLVTGVRDINHNLSEMSQQLASTAVELGYLRIDVDVLKKNLDSVKNEQITIKSDLNIANRDLNVATKKVSILCKNGAIYWPKHGGCE